MKFFFVARFCPRLRNTSYDVIRCQFDLGDFSYFYGTYTMEKPCGRLLFQLCLALSLSLRSSLLLLKNGLTESPARRFELIWMQHWSLTEIRDAYGVTRNQHIFLVVGVE